MRWGLQSCFYFTLGWRAGRPVDRARLRDIIDLMPVDQRYLQLLGLRIGDRESGPPEGTPIIMIHGWAASSRIWLETIERLQSRFRCLALDLPGYGLSENPPIEWQTVDNYVEISWIPDAHEVAERAKRNLRDLTREFALGSMGSLMEHSMPDQVAQLSVPRLTLGGQRDCLVPADKLESLAGEMPNARAAILESAHHPFHDSPQTYLGETEAFLDSLGGS